MNQKEQYKVDRLDSEVLDGLAALKLKTTQAMGKLRSTLTGRIRLRLADEGIRKETATEIAEALKAKVSTVSAILFRLVHTGKARRELHQSYRFKTKQVYKYF
jgi:DNA-binding MarR family transcriptional regulator